MSLPRVVVAEDNPRFCLDRAQTHGQIVFLSNQKLNPFTVDGVQGIFSHRLDEIRFDPNTDIVCLTGQSLTVALMMAVIGAKYKSHTVKLLMYNSTTSDYRLRVMDLTKE